MVKRKTKEDKILKKYKETFDALEEYDRTGQLPKEMQERIDKQLKEKNGKANI